MFMRNKVLACILLSICLNASFLSSVQSQEIHLVQIDKLSPLRVHHFAKYINSSELRRRSTPTHKLDSAFFLNYWNVDFLIGVSAKYVLDLDRKIDSIFSYRLDIENNVFNPSTFLVQYFNDNGSISHYTNNNWDGTRIDLTDKLPNLDRVYKYNTLDQIILIETRSKEDFEIGRPSNQFRFHYDSLSRLQLTEYYFRTEDTLQLSSSTEYEYNDDNLLAYTTSCKYENMGTSKLKKDSVIYSYHSDGNLFEEKNFVWKDNVYNPTFGSRHIYNAYGNIDFVTPLNYDLEQDWYEEDIRNKYYYDDTQNLIRTKRWWYQEGSWIEELEETVYIHQLDVRDENVLYPSIYTFHHAQEYMLLEKKEYDLNVGQFDERVLQNSSDYIYKGIEPSSIIDTHKEELPIDIFPNPVRDLLKFTTSKKSEVQVSIFNFQGILMSRKTLILKDDIDVSTLKSGIYFLTASTNDSFCTKKFVVFR